MENKKISIVRQMNIKSFVFIALGPLLGQGAMFIAHTYLIFNKRIDLVGSIGIGLGILTLFQWISDSGGTFLFSKFMKDSLSSTLSYYIGRIIISIFILIIYFMLYHFMLYHFIEIFHNNEIVLEIFKLIPIIIILGAFNLTGLVDYLKLNHHLILFSGLNWSIPAVTILFMNLNESAEHIGQVLGISYIFGVLITILVQYYVSFKVVKNIFSKLNDIKFNSIMETMADSVLYNLSFISSQVYGRIVPIVIEYYLSASTVGIYLYSRSIINILGQFIGFARRTEFNQLFKINISKLNLLELIKIQKLSFLMSLLFVLLFGLLWIITLSFEIKSFKEILYMLNWMMIIFIFFNFSSAYSQLLISQKFLLADFIIQFTTVLLSFLLIYIFINSLGIVAVFISEILMLLIRIIMYRNFILQIRLN